MEDDEQETWRGVWRAIEHRRVARALSWRSLERNSDVSLKTLAKMRDDGTPLQSPAKRASLAAALGWSSDSIDLLAAGEPPREAPGPIQRAVELRENRRPVRPPEDLVIDYLEGRIVYLENDMRAALGAIVKYSADMSALVSRLAALEKTTNEMGERLLELGEQTLLPDDDEVQRPDETGAAESRS